MVAYRISKVHNSESFRSRTILDRWSTLARWIPYSMLSQIVVLFTDSESSQNQFKSTTADSLLTFIKEAASEVLNMNLLKIVHYIIPLR